ncbi:hypothetical protein SAMN05444161_0595 [Rhizobiales bacterium GAS191]|jgi:hypothetical protein|nr:hypothetical protein SAMN05444161_0595 [Rhizobiales bacterium GAS191]SED06190.1 hypothetical protein SAMN05519104_2707 [Rhizobiales bacterium GAS188]
MTLHVFSPAPAAPHAARLVLDIFRRLAAFREDYDEAVLHGLAAMLRRHMPEGAADKVTSDALVMDNEIRFRLPAGLAMQPQGEFRATHEEAALLSLVRHADDADDRLAVEAAERLGIVYHRVLRNCARMLARSLRQGGVETEWEAAPAAMRRAPRAPPRADMCR